MAEHSAIEWTDHTLNFWIGCQEVSPACDHCYAKVQNEHRKWVAGWGPAGERRRTAISTWQQLRAWNKRAKAAGVREKVFSNSLSDFFDNRAAATWRREAWHYIEQCDSLDFLILTKRPQNVTKMLPDPESGTKPWGAGWPNVWLGTTAENQAEADRRIPHLLAVPAAKRFLSCEPLLGPLQLSAIPTEAALKSDDPDWLYNAFSGENYFMNDGFSYGGDGPDWGTLDWIIAGGESGPGARPMHPDWARSLRDQCQVAGVPFFFKQWGEWAPPEVLAVDTPEALRCRTGDRVFTFDDLQQMGRVGKKAAGAQLDGREWREMPHV